MTATSSDEVLHERDDELTVLARAWDDAAAGAGRAVLVEGSAGIGKTRLLDEVVRLVDGRGRVLRGRGGELEKDVPLLVTRELFTPYVVAADGQELDRVFSGAAGLAGPLLGRGAAAPSAESGFALVHGIYWLVANLAETQPLALVVDDVHWVDEPTQRWLAYLLPRLGELPVLMVLAARPRELAPDSSLGRGLAGAHEVQVVRPGALSPAATHRLVAATLPSPEPAFGAAAHRATGGNPLLLRSLAAAVRDRGLEPTAANAHVIEKLGSLELRRIIRPRLHALGDAPVGLARAVATLGDGCDLQDAAELAGVTWEAGAAAHDRLVVAEVLRHDSLAFTHPLVRAAVVEELPAGTRQALHVRAARVLHRHGAPAGAVARHLAAAGPVREGWVVPVLRAAADQALARSSPEEALTYLAAALQEHLDPAERFGLLLDAGWQALRSLDPRGLAWFEEALRIAPDRRAAYQAWGALWNWRTLFKRGLDPDTVLDGLPDDPEPRQAYGIQSSLLLDLGFSGANLRRQVDRFPVPSTSPAGETLPEIRWLVARAVDETLRGGSARRALDLVDRVDLSRLLRTRSDVPTVVWLCVARLGAGDLSGAERVAHGMLRQGRASGSVMTTQYGEIGLGFAGLLRGDVRGAASMFAPWLAGSVEFATAVTVPSVCAVTVEIHLAQSRPEEAWATLRRWGLDEDVPSDWHGAVLLDRRARLRRAEGDLTAALADHERTRDVLATFDAVENPLAPWRIGMAECLAALGRQDEARALAEEQVERARSFGSALLLGPSLGALAAIVGGQQGTALAQESVDVLEEVGAPGAEARARLALGRLLRREREPGRARAVLGEALGTADRLGHLGLADEVEQELRLTGARPRRRAVTGVQALTPAELRVASLAAEGLSNPEIAQSIFVTRKTVEKHLGAAFLKLHVSSRDQLPVALHVEHAAG